MRILSRYLAVAFLWVLPISLFAQTGSLTTEETLKQLILLVSQYDSRIRFLESENTILKNEMMKAGIKIPLTVYTGSVIQEAQSTTIPSTYLTGILTPPSPPVDLTGALITQMNNQYGNDITGFIMRIQKEWKDIRNVYKLPENAHIGGYEFVQSGSLDHVFVDIVFGTGTAGVYDAKILYQFEKKVYKRKLIGFFEYNTTTTRYTTRSGSNPFTGILRTFIRDPYYAGIAGTPSTAVVTISSSGAAINPGNTTVVPSGNTGVVSTASISDVEKAYTEKRYLSVISLSNGYLVSNNPTYELLRIRYRTYFIIGKYSESLAEIAKIQSLGKLDKQTACDAQVIATYSKDTSLVSKYATTCSGK